MTNCTHCGEEISPAATACPHCGGELTPSAPPLELAGFGSRAAAWLLDVLVLLLPTLLVNITVLPLIGSLLVEFLYHWLTVAYWDGQTIGKRALGIRIARPDGSPVDTNVAAGRSLMRIVSGIPFGLGFLWAAWEPNKRTWHDMTADTRVYRVSR